MAEPPYLASAIGRSIRLALTFLRRQMAFRRSVLLLLPAEKGKTRCAARSVAEIGSINSSRVGSAGESADLK